MKLWIFNKNFIKNLNFPWKISHPRRTQYYFYWTNLLVIQPFPSSTVCDNHILKHLQHALHSWFVLKFLAQRHHPSTSINQHLKYLSPINIFQKLKKAFLVFLVQFSIFLISSILIILIILSSRDLIDLLESFVMFYHIAKSKIKFNDFLQIKYLNFPMYF